MTQQKRDQERWQVGGLTDKSGAVGRRVPVAELPFGEIRVPRVWLDAGDRLVWDPSSWRYARPLPEMLDAFVELWREPGSAAAILIYAKKWGPLYLDHGGRPCNRFVEREPGKQPPPRPEPLESWRYFSRRAHAVLSIAALLNQEKAGSKTDWAAFGPILDRLGGWEAVKDLDELSFPLGAYAARGCPREPSWTLEFERTYLAAEVNLWLSIGRPVFSLGIGQKGWQLEIDYRGFMFTAISLQLAQAVAGADRLFICSGCHRPYVRDVPGKKRRKPNAGQKNYCPNCVPQALREANDRLREKVAEARRLRAEGVGLREIAKTLNVRTSKRSTALQTVRRWVGKGE